ncbi:flavodoxin [Anaerocolumna xylanovorans]|uniref:Flavodoxin n=1 Tax=Anaerocolumna xylanovorans DSM 12503 TaxID=1121345 RepID=A0A1M7XVV8_9FIRM|nr:flavodoxin [Anaerocolumna xylanovorans]SHO42850.1 Flavodoxin [Anaerocolumna xylanovorans DSM 12503]
MSKIAVVYYSYTNNTKKIAEMIQSKTGAEVFQIETVTPYTGSYDEVVNQAQKEINSGFKPPIQSLKMQLDQYDTVILGTPVWWYTMAPAVFTFLSEADLSGKKIIPFATNAGWLGHTFKDIKKLCPDSEVVSGMNIEFSKEILKTSIKAIESWIVG